MRPSLSLQLICVVLWGCQPLKIQEANPEKQVVVTEQEQVAALGGAAFVEPDLLEIKFHDGLEIRLWNGQPSDRKGTNLKAPQAVGLLERMSKGGIWVKSFSVSEKTINKLQLNAVNKFLRDPGDLNLYFRLRLPKGSQANEILAEFQTLPEVEAVYRVPRPVRMNVPLRSGFNMEKKSTLFSAKLAPNYYDINKGPYQEYLNSAPKGIDERYANSNGKSHGANVRICDVEYSFNKNHGDIGKVTIIGPPGRDPFNDSNHGTAVLGEFGSLANNQGTTGIAYSAEKLFSPAQTEKGYNPGDAIINCVENTSPGDIILIEQQIVGPNGDEKYVPVEWYKPWYVAIKKAVDANRIVLEAAGNGGEDLDSPIFSQGNDGHHPFLAENDSGAIIVGAGKSFYYGTEARSAHDFSNYGSTVDLQGWGDHVISTGYGDLYGIKGLNWYYTSTFSGTSSATPIVAGAAATLQGFNRKLHRVPLTPALIKSILRTTGTAQTGSKNIGSLPNLKEALIKIR